MTLAALFFIHRDEAPTLIRVGMLSLAISIAASLFIDPTDTGNPIVTLLTIGYGVGALILGWPAYRSPKLNKGIGIAALLTGAASWACIFAGQNGRPPTTPDVVRPLPANGGHAGLPAGQMADRAAPP